jgi:hypothetical protein
LHLSGGLSKMIMTKGFQIQRIFPFRIALHHPDIE